LMQPSHYSLLGEVQTSQSSDKKNGFQTNLQPLSHYWKTFYSSSTSANEGFQGNKAI